MSSPELALIHAAVAAGHPWARMTLDSLRAQEAADALLEEERELEQEASRNQFDEIGVLLDEAEASVDILAEDSLLNVGAEMQTTEIAEVQMADVEATPVAQAKDVARITELDLEGADIINNNTSAGKEVDAKSTKRTYKRVNVAYQSFLSLIQAHDGKGGLSSLDVYLPEQMHDYVNRKLVRLFVKTYVRNTGYSKTHYNEAVNFMQRLLEDKMSEHGAVARKGSIKEDKFLKDFLNEVQIIKGDLERASGIDIQESLDSEISRSDELLLVDICYDPTTVSTLAFITKSNVVSGYVHSAQVGTRGSDSRGMMFHHGFVRKMEYLGDGEDVDHFIHNQGKTNRVGRRIYKAFACHMNPRMDTSAHLGMNLLLRYMVLGEPFPDFLCPVDYAHRPIFRSVNSYAKSYPSSTQYSNWKAIYAAAGIRCAKVTHQNRGQVQQRLSDKGCPLDTIERFIGCGDRPKANERRPKGFVHAHPSCSTCLWCCRW